jgi:feruloyl esterase
MKQCDHLDGYVDGILEDPSLCHYDPSGLLCKTGGSTNTSCLTETQLNTVRQIHSPLLQKDGSVIYPRMHPGGGFSSIYNGRPFAITGEWYRNVIYANKSWDSSKITLEDMAYASKLNPSNAETWNGDISAFKARGAKVIHYHGLMDPVISSDNSARYYQHVQDTMKLKPAQLDEFYRYFRISGMGHCGNGKGAWAVGQSAKAVSSTDSGANVVSAIIKWVEEGQAPESLLGTKFVGDAADKGVSFKRRHCRYPLRNKYKGSGNAADPENWQCIE